MEDEGSFTPSASKSILPVSILSVVIVVVELGHASHAPFIWLFLNIKNK